MKCSCVLLSLHERYRRAKKFETSFKPLAPVQPAALPMRSAQPGWHASPQIPFDFLYKIRRPPWGHQAVERKQPGQSMAVFNFQRVNG